MKVFFLILVIFCSTSCIKTIHTCGHIFKDSEIHDIEKAKDKKDVEGILGSPTTVSYFGQETWFYITTRKETIAFLPSKVLEQYIVAITFNENKVDEILRYTEKNANGVISVSEYTVTKGNDISAAQHMFGNLGRFNSNKVLEPAKPRSGF